MYSFNPGNSFWLSGSNLLSSALKLSMKMFQTGVISYSFTAVAETGLTLVALAWEDVRVTYLAP